MVSARRLFLASRAEIAPDANHDRSSGSNSANGTDVILAAAGYAAIDAFAAANGLMADVPEPTCFGLLGLAAAGVLARRRRSA